MSQNAQTHKIENSKIVAITLATPAKSRTLEQERKQAIDDLLLTNTFDLVGRAEGPYHLKLGIMEQRLNFEVNDTSDQLLYAFLLSMRPYKKAIQDYLGAVGQYEGAQAMPRDKVEMFDRVRRMLHDEAANDLIKHLDGKVAIDHDTARRLFTLICALHLGSGQNVWLHAGAQP